MNRRILIQVTAPTVLIGLLLFGACLVSAWYLDRLQANRNQILSQNVTSLEAAQNVEISVRQLRFHCFLYLANPSSERLEKIENSHAEFEQALATARRSVQTPEEQACIEEIEDGYRQYHQALTRLRTEVNQAGFEPDLSKLDEANPIMQVVGPCEKLLNLNKKMMVQTAQDSDRINWTLRSLMFVLGLAGPAGGLLLGYGMARGLSRSIYQLSVRVQDINQHLEQELEPVKMMAGGDLENLDRQLQHVLGRVQETAERFQRHQQEMLRAQQLSALGQLAASIAHEVRNPLTSVKLLIEGALRDRKPRPLNSDGLKIIHGEVLRLEQIVQGFLDFARPPRLQRAACDLREVVRQAVALTSSRAKQQQVRIEVRADDAPVVCQTDRDHLRTVLVNLLINSLDALPTGGEIIVEAQDAGGEIFLTVSDSGPGIRPEILPKLFTPFVSTKETGCGLGLCICKRVVEEHDGRIEAENHAEGGARFLITLPKK